MNPRPILAGGRLALTLTLALVVSGCASAGRGAACTIEAGFFTSYQEALARAAAVREVLGAARVDTDLIHYTAVYRVHSGSYHAPRDAVNDIAKLGQAGIKAAAVPKL
ncbi:MAG: hypothetical protein LBK76_03320 [Verrucomicrobiales bacterium]|jgi:hypothetical protein|nr:hypothetical protein [Verrucomicrobiales bacterium]